MLVSCANCNKDIEKYPSEVKEKNFCSQNCFLSYKNNMFDYILECESDEGAFNLITEVVKQCFQAPILNYTNRDRSLTNTFNCRRKFAKSHLLQIWCDCTEEEMFMDYKYIRNLIEAFNHKVDLINLVILKDKEALKRLGVNRQML